MPESLIDYRNRLRQYIQDACYDMEHGEQVGIEGHRLREAFPHNRFTGRPTMDAFLESMIGSNYGAWKIEHDRVTDRYFISRHEPGNERVREDWDRR